LPEKRQYQAVGDVMKSRGLALSGILDLVSVGDNRLYKKFCHTQMLAASTYTRSSRPYSVLLDISINVAVYMKPERSVIEILFHSCQQHTAQ
jgi:hypothetical protein